MDFKELPDGVQSMILGHVVSDEEAHLRNLQQQQNTFESRLEERQQEKRQIDFEMEMNELNPFMEQPLNPQDNLSAEERETYARLSTQISDLQGRLRQNAEQQARPRAMLAYLNMYQRRLN